MDFGKATLQILGNDDGLTLLVKGNGRHTEINIKSDSCRKFIQGLQDATDNRRSFTEIEGTFQYQETFI